jgi:hypothetical protein
VPEQNDPKDYRDLVADPKPGTDAAVNRGCKCPVIDNHRGKGYHGDGKNLGWIITEGCHLHSFRTETYEHKIEYEDKPKQETAEEREARFRDWLFK